MRKYVFKKTHLKIIMPLIDLAGTILYAPLRVFRRRPKDIKKILVARMDQAGDMIQAKPFFAGLKSKYPKAEVHVLCHAAAAFIANADKNVDYVISTEKSWFYPESLPGPADIKELKKILAGGKYDIGFDVRGDIRIIKLLRGAGIKYLCGYGCAGGGFMLDCEKPYDRNDHEISKCLKLICEKPAQEIKMDFDMGKNAEAKAGEILKEHGKEKNIIVHPFTRAKSKMWGNAKFSELMEKIIKTNRGAAVFVIGSPDEQEFRTGFQWGGRIHDLIGKLKFAETVELIKKADVFIGSDSGPQYFASYSGVKTCVIYGYTVNYKRWQPMVPENGFIDVSLPVPCGPCELSVCNQPEHRCMDIIKVDDVYDKIKKWIV